MDTKTILAVVVGLLIAITGVLVFGDRKPAEVQQPQPPLGATPGNDAAPNGYYSLNGVQYFSYNQSLVGTTTNPCSVKNPFTGTSTVIRYSFSVTNNQTGVAQEVQLSTTTGATNGFGATTTAVSFIKHVIGISKDSFMYVPGASEANATIAPGEFLSLRMATATPRSLAAYMVGSCHATIEAAAN